MDRKHCVDCGSPMCEHTLCCSVCGSTDPHFEKRYIRRMTGLALLAAAILAIVLVISVAMGAGVNM
jgi:predicted nucleic acid-binding Zn ribbon protein